MPPVIKNEQKEFIKMKRYFSMILALAVVACSSTYYGAMEKFGVYKRDILVDRVVETRDAQNAAKKEFDSALMQFRSVVRFSGGDLEKEYKRLQNAYDRSQKAADEVSQRIRSIERVAQDLFREWQKELKLYENPMLREQSAAQLAQTQHEYRQLMQALKTVEAKMPPVLNVFRDQVLYLKHHLNAQAVSALHQEYRRIEYDVSQLIAQINRSINEANQFINKMKRAAS